MGLGFAAFAMKVKLFRYASAGQERGFNMFLFISADS